MRIIIGIDPGLAATGYGIISSANNRHTYIAHGAIRTAAGEPLDQRLLIIYQELSRLVEKYRPGEAGVETIYFAKNIKTAIPVAHARGAALTALAAAGIKVGEYSPLEIKQAVAGRGRAEKQQVQQMVKVLLGLSKIPTPDHAADALAAAICHSHLSQFKQYIK